MIILGIDPGLQRLGWGVLSKSGNALKFIAAGVISSPDSREALAERLKVQHEALSDVIKKYAPDVAAVEETFVNVSGSSTLKLGQARGAILLTLALHGLPVHEYAPNLIKKTLVGNGHADKTQVAHMVKLLLPGHTATKADATDALAIAICHSHHRHPAARVSESAGSRKK